MRIASFWIDRYFASFKGSTVISLFSGVALVFRGRYAGTPFPPKYLIYILNYNIFKFHIYIF